MVISLSNFPVMSLQQRENVFLKNSEQINTKDWSTPNNRWGCLSKFSLVIFFVAIIIAVAIVIMAFLLPGLDSGTRIIISSSAGGSAAVALVALGTHLLVYCCKIASTKQPLPSRRPSETLIDQAINALKYYFQVQILSKWRK